MCCQQTLSPATSGAQPSGRGWSNRCCAFPQKAGPSQRASASTEQIHPSLAGRAKLTWRAGAFSSWSSTHQHQPPTKLQQLSASNLRKPTTHLIHPTIPKNKKSIRRTRAPLPVDLNFPKCLSSWRTLQSSPRRTSPRRSTSRSPRPRSSQRYPMLLLSPSAQPNFAPSTDRYPCRHREALQSRKANAPGKHRA